MKGVYQLRKFTEINGEKLKLTQNEPFDDIYLHKRGHTMIGIKFRQPKVKQYGWRLTDFECKIAEYQKFQEGGQMQIWKKYKFSLDDKIKLKIRKITKSQKQQERQKVQQSDDEEQITKNKLIKKAKKIYKQVSKVLMKSNLKNNSTVFEWVNDKELSQTDLELFVLTKDKEKSYGKQIGTIKVEGLINSKQICYYQTECVEGQNPNPLLSTLKEWNNVNVSYPQLLQSLIFNESLHQQKNN